MKILSAKLSFLFLAFIPIHLAAEEPIKIGLLTDLSGPAAYWGSQSRLGAEMIRDELNAANKSVEIIFEDQNLKPKNAVSGAQKLIFVDKVDAVYSEFTVTTIAASPVVKNNKKLFIGICAANSFLERNPYSYKSYIDYVEGCKAVAAYWKKQGIEKVAALKAETEYGDLCVEGLKKVFPKSYVIDYAYGQEVRTQALLLKKNAAQAVLNASFQGDILNMMAAFSTISYFPYIGANFDAITDRIFDKYPEQEQKFISFGFRSVSPDFIKKVKARDPKNSLVAIEGAALSYLHIRQMVEAIRSCKREDIECQTKNMSQMGKNSRDIIGFERFRDRQAVFALGLKRRVNGKEEWIDKTVL